MRVHEPITGEQLAESLGVAKPTLRSDLAILVMIGMIGAKPKVGYFLGSSISASGENLKHLRTLKIKDVLGVPIIIRETTTVQDAVVTLFLENVGSLIVTNPQGELTGVVSRKDLLKIALGNQQAPQMPVSLVMTREPNIITMRPDDTVIDAAEKMIQHQIDTLPILDEGANGQMEIVGRVTKTTMTRVLVELARK